MPALVAVVRQAERLVLLDPAFGLGDGIVCSEGDEVRLLRTSERGHMAEQAVTVARMLRRAGWKVRVRDCADLRPRQVPVVGGRRSVLPETRGEVHAVAAHAAAALIASIGERRQKTPDPFKTYAVPEPPPPPTPPSHKKSNPRRLRCRECGHVTLGRGIDSHEASRGHKAWERVTRQPDGTYAPAPTQEGSPELAGSTSSAPEQPANGISHPADPASPEGCMTGGPPRRSETGLHAPP